jgi:hypothetical protein
MVTGPREGWGGGTWQPGGRGGSMAEGAAARERYRPGRVGHLTCGAGGGDDKVRYIRKGEGEGGGGARTEHQ